MTRKFVLFAVLTFIFASGCRKTKLKDDMEILAGDWKWVYTEEYVDPNIFTPANLESVVDADSFPIVYRLEFFSNGKMTRWQDEDETKDRIVVKNFEQISSTYYSIRVRGDNKEKKELNMILLDRTTDTLIVNEYPFADVHDANGRSYYHRNYFVRQ